tara:strand:+ start:992 stop:1162 length:171 start_codon:yes stop_codon:yes gene_type:complete
MKELIEYINMSSFDMINEGKQINVVSTNLIEESIEEFISDGGNAMSIIEFLQLRHE